MEMSFPKKSLSGRTSWSLLYPFALSRHTPPPSPPGPIRAQRFIGPSLPCLPYSESPTLPTSDLKLTNSSLWSKLSEVFMCGNRSPFYGSYSDAIGSVSSGAP